MKKLERNYAMEIVRQRKELLRCQQRLLSGSGWDFRWLLRRVPIGDNRMKVTAVRAGETMNAWKQKSSGSNTVT